MKLLLFFIVLALAAVARSETLTVLNWEEFLSQKVVEEWQKKSGHTLNQIYYDNDEDRDRILVGHQDRIIDLVISDETASKFFGDSGRFLSLAEFGDAQIMSRIDPEWHETCNGYGVPYLWGTLGVVYRLDRFSEAPRSWQVLLQPSPALQGHIGLMEDYVDLLAPALLSRGLPVNTADTDHLKAAFDDMARIVPHVLTFEYAISAVDNPELAQALHIAMAYSGDQDAMNEKLGKTLWAYTTLEEGSIAWVDCLAIMKDSPRRNIALDFIRYLYQPEVAAQNAEAVYAAVPMKEAKQLQSIAFQNDRTVYPSAADMAKLQRYQPMDAATILRRNRMTSSLVKLHESK